VTSRTAGRVAIAGGGIGGLGCALGLARHGFDVVVLEQARSFGEAGVGLQVAPNALAVLDALGVGAEAKKNALFIERLVVMDSVSGEKVLEIPTGPAFEKRFGNPYAVAHRADIHGALLRGCQSFRSIELSTDSRVVDFDTHDRGVSVRLATGDLLEAAALVGADGIRSQIRAKIVGDGEPPSAGAYIYRALIPAADMPKDEQKPYPTLWVGPGTHAIYYPVRDWAAFNFAATVVASDGTAKGEGEATPEEAMAALLSAHPALLRVMRVPPRFNRYIIRHREPIETWTVGRVTLLGDAAHPMVQYLAQGAAMALEDGICLANCAEEAGGDFAAAFQHYQALRLVRAARVQISSLMLDKFYHARGVERLVRNAMFEGRSTEDYYDRLSWLYQSPPYVR
jgi:3-hydroxybenzoate 6-monooxygenase